MKLKAFKPNKSAKDARTETANKIAGVPINELSPRARAALSTLTSENAMLRSLIEQLQTQLGEAREQADLDPLVPVFNRRAFERELSRAVHMCERYNMPSAFVYIDLDGFKQINDAFGHSAGDAALLHVGKTLLAQVRESDVVGRLGGDEFGVILAQAGPDDAAAKAKALISALQNAPACYDDIPLAIDASFGIYPFAPGEKAASIIARADEAMYAQKALRKAARNSSAKTTTATA